MKASNVAKILLLLPSLLFFQGRSEVSPSNASPLRVSNSSSLLFFYRNASIIEITGNEQTFVAALRLRFDLDRDLWKGAALHLRADVLVNEDLSLKGRLFEAMNPPRFSVNDLSADLVLGEHHRITFGMAKPLFFQLPMETLTPPIAFKTLAKTDGSLLPNALVTGWRDVPIAYAGLLPWVDTGIWYRLGLGAFRLGLGFANGEEGLDANSDKAVSLLLGAETPGFKAGITASTGEFGSVPIKEWRHPLKLYVYGGRDFTLGAEAMVVATGIRATNSLLSNNASPWLGGVQSWFGLTDGFFTPFSVVSEPGRKGWMGLPDSMVFSAAAFVYADFPRILDGLLHVTAHAGFYDPDVRTDVYDWLQPRFRAFLRVWFKPSPHFGIFVSDGFTWDPSFQNTANSQFFDREDRKLHPLLDNDVHIGFTLNPF